MASSSIPSLDPSSPSSSRATNPLSPTSPSTTTPFIPPPSSSSSPIPNTLSNRVLWSGELSIKPTSFLSKWKTRFFVLRPFTIDIYEDLVGLFNALPVASIPLIHINGAIAAIDNDNNNNKDGSKSPPTSPRSKTKKAGLQIPTLNKIWTLMSSHFEERDEWINQLNNALSLLSLSSNGRKTTSAAAPPLKRLASKSVVEDDPIPNSAPSNDNNLAAALNDGIDTTSSADVTAAAATTSTSTTISNLAPIINDNPNNPTTEDIIANSISIGHADCDSALAHEALSNYNAAIIHWQKANQEADKHPLAIWRIANRFWWGWGCKRDHTVAKKLWEIGANKGQVGCVSRCYQFGLGGKSIDEKKAYQMMYEFGTKGNDVDAQCVIGTYYDHGTGIIKDSKLAIAYYQRAASKGHGPALFNLAVCCMTGTGMSPSTLEGCYYYKKATESNHGAAAYNLGLSYKIGAGVKKNETRSKEWISKANEWGHVGQYSHTGKETAESIDSSLEMNPAIQGSSR